MGKNGRSLNILLNMYHENVLNFRIGRTPSNSWQVSIALLNHQRVVGIAEVGYTCKLVGGSICSCSCRNYIPTYGFVKLDHTHL